MSKEGPLQRVPFFYGDDFEFPAADSATAEGVLALGGEVSVLSLRRAYSQGVFPWPVDPRYPILWFSPPERCIFELDHFHVSRSLKKVIQRGHFEVRFDTAFEEVIGHCATTRRDGYGTWIDQRMLPAYVALFELGRHDNLSAHSVEVFLDDELVGGLYGIAYGGVFTGESMFHRVDNASKVALFALVERMKECAFSLLDAQVPNPHLTQMGAEIISRARFLERLESTSGDDCLLS
jgi:leucyl/phenylalanyl-tRNA--protein transferase